MQNALKRVGQKSMPRHSILKRANLRWVSFATEIFVIPSGTVCHSERNEESLYEDIRRLMNGAQPTCHPERSEESLYENTTMHYYVYILTKASRTLYVGVTSNLQRRVFEHKQKLIPGFTRKYNITKLDHFEMTSDIHAALAREKQIKSWSHDKKIALIEQDNSTWCDVSDDWL